MKQNSKQLIISEICFLKSLFTFICLISLSSCNVFQEETQIDERFRPGLSDSAFNKAPSANSNTLSVSINTATNGTLSATDANPDDVFSFSITSQGTKGVATITNAVTGAFTYTPNLSALGSDSFSFKVSDGIVDSNIATISITIFDPNTPPVATDLNPASFNEDTLSVITLSYSDVDNDLGTSCALSSLTNIGITQACACDGSGVCTVGVTGVANHFGAASFDYTVTANSQASNTATATLSISSINDAPTISSITDTSTNEDAAKAISFTISDVDHALTCASSVSMSSTNTTLIPNANVVWSINGANCVGTITPAANEFGSSDITFTVSDGSLSAQDTFTLTVSQLADDAFSMDWLFNFAGWNNASTGYTLSDANNIKVGTSPTDVADDVVYLVGTDQVDDDNTATGFAGGTLSGVSYGVLSDGVTQGLKLGNGGGCDGAAGDCTKQVVPEIYELHESWTPQWGSLKSYFNFIGTGNIANGVTINASVGAAAVSTNPDGSGLSYVTGQVGAGIYTDDTDSRLIVAAAEAPDLNDNQSLSLWVKADPSNIRNWASFWSKEACCGTGWLLSRFNGTNQISVRINTDAGGNQRKDSSNSSILDGSWNHIAVTFTPGVVKLYVNGTLGNTWGYNHGSGLSTTANYYPVGDRSGISVDEVGYWDITLTDTDVQTIYHHQKSKYAGVLDSRVMDAKNISSWTTLSPVPTIPSLKELPDSTCTPEPCTHNNPEDSTKYSSLVGSTGLTSDGVISTDGLVGLWHFNETSWNGIAGEVKDTSGQGNHGRAINGANTTSSATFYRGGSFDGDNDVVTISNSTITLISQLSYSLWTYIPSDWSPTAGEYNIMLEKGSGSEFFTLHSSTAGGSLMYARFATTDAINITSVIADFSLYKGGWHHIGVTYDGNIIKTYFDGVFVNSTPLTGTIDTSGRNLTIGGRTGSSSTEQYYGLIDELAIWNRRLHASEIKQLYQRGASRLKYQVRTCDDSGCSGESWQGPDGTSGTFFSELNNNSIPLTMAGNVKPSLPVILFSDYTSSPSNNRYFQYRTIFETDATDITLGPELKSVSVDPIHYSKEETIYGNEGVSFFNLSSFVQNLGSTAGCSSGVVYNLSLDKSTWKYWNGTSWVNSNGTSAQANTASAIHTALSADATKFRTDVGVGSVYFKAFLKSSGTSKCELNDLQIGGSK